MENRGNSKGDGDAKKAPARAVARTTDLIKAKATIKEDDLTQGSSSDLPNMAMSSAPSGSSPYASSQLPPASKDRDTQKLEHAPPREPMVDLLERPPAVSASNHKIAPGAFPVRSARNTATSRTFRSPIMSYDSPRELTNEESKQEDGVPNSAAAGIGLYAVEAQRVPDGNEDGTVMVAEAQYVRRMKWYQRRWIVVGLALCACGFAAAVIVMVVLFVRQPAAAPAPISSTSVRIACNFLSISNVTVCRSTFLFDTNADDKTTGSSIPSEIGLLTQLTLLNFAYIGLTSAIPSEIGLLTQLSILDFGVNEVKGAIPSEIGLLTRLTALSFYDNSLTSTIPSEIGLLTQLTYLSFYDNSLTSSIPSEIGLLTKLTYLGFSSNTLTSTIPSEIGLLTQLRVLEFSFNLLTSTIPSAIGLLTLLESLWFTDTTLTGTIPSSLCALPSPPSIYIDCGAITCASGCCVDSSGSSCGFTIF
ncbi:hypothetical protein MHU86_11281 [Fragilaria crotonensis]|nr:hypothetical protein MHU86_11281 [Fragilaria crotonensis]